jgi:hypothetical protein
VVPFVFASHRRLGVAVGTCIRYEAVQTADRDRESVTVTASQAGQVGTVVACLSSLQYSDIKTCGDRLIPKCAPHRPSASSGLFLFIIVVLKYKLWNWEKMKYKQTFVG